MARTSKLEQRMGGDEFKRLSAAGMQDPTNRKQYSAKEVIAEFRGRGDSKVDEGDGNIKQRFLDAQAGGAKFNQRAQNYLTEQHGFDFGKSTDVTPEKQKEAEAFKDEKVNQVINNAMNSEGPAARAEETLLTGSGDNMNMSFDRVFGDSQSAIRDNNIIHGNFNPGNQDYSTNIGTQSGGSSLAMRKKMLGL